MNKIVCDVCGTSYPETAEQCPICGTAKTDTTKNAAGTQTGYAYVKGGRFSHANVRKRNAGNKELPRVVAPVKPQKEAAPKPQKEAKPKVEKQVAPAAPKKEQPARRQASAAAAQKPNQEKRGVNILLAVIALLLVLAILAVFAYIVKGYIDDKDATEPAGSSTTQPSESLEIPCTGVRLALSEKKFTSPDAKFQLSVTCEPKDTTDSVWYESSDENVATVDEKGVVTPVADGTAIIYVHCGEFTAECSITCEMGVEPPQPTDPTDPTDPTEPAFVLTLKKDDISLSGYNDSAIIYDGEIDASEIIWTSSDETVATVANGKVIAVGNGNATITAEYMGQTASCIVRCSNVVVSDYVLKTRFGNGSDFTISVGSTITLYLEEEATGKKIQPENLTFTLSKEGVISIDENGEITALASGKVTVTVTYGDVVLKSIVRVTK